ncbi:baseplate J/gp47 family protein [Dichelobacter nodosus]|uniref:baseplate J/gp47 family protein n=1 Tax=Dichelobacter nodosus TaxID=870 RepID=UPI000682094A|nr:baseplate J/gp47 family protein [Dichelobacter nodosus]KNZ39958.1 hypothetical protein AKG33_01020 [Dichelobacter nodosus]
MNTPTIIEPLNYEQIFERRKAAFIALWPAHDQQAWADTLALESEPVTKLLEESAYLELLLRARINDAALANLLIYACDTDLDRLADFYGLIRMHDETDEQFRARLILRIRASSTAGPAVYYRYHALASSTHVRDVYVSSPKPGLVRIAVIAQQGIASKNLLNKVSAYINRSDIRVLTDTVTVTAATVQGVDIHAEITLLPDAPEDTLRTLEAQLRGAVGSQLGLGRDLTRSWIISILHGAGVQKVNLISPTSDIVISQDEAAEINAVHLILIGRDY